MPKNIDQKTKRINNYIYIYIYFIGMCVRCSQEVSLFEYKLKQSGYKSNLSEGRTVAQIFASFIAIIL